VGGGGGGRGGGDMRRCSVYYDIFIQQLVGQKRDVAKIHIELYKLFCDGVVMM